MRACGIFIRTLTLVALSRKSNEPLVSGKNGRFVREPRVVMIYTGRSGFEYMNGVGWGNADRSSISVITIMSSCGLNRMGLCRLLILSFV